MRKIFVLLALAVTSSGIARERTVWLSDARQLACSPDNVERSGRLTLKLGPDHGRQLAIRRHADNTWYFLVVDNPPDNAKTLMTPEAFEKLEEIIIPASSITTEWTTGEDVPVFPTSGKYSIYVSNNLESEDGGYMCTIRFVH